jgi:DNA repair exonuclease SbcCD ATPase subunit
MFKNLKSLFIEEVEDSGKKTTTKEKKGNAPATSTPPVKARVSESKSGDPGQVTKKFMEILLRAMEANNLDGFDYLEYKQSLKSLEKMPMDESTRFQSAFAMAQTMGATPAKLIETAEHYIKVLQAEEKKFEDALTHQRSKQIGSKNQQINKLEENIKSKAAQIKKLTQEIEADQKKAEALKSEIKQASQKVESTKNNFIASYNALIDKISGDIEKMSKYLK